MNDQEDTIENRHKAERRALQAKIQGLKSTTPKNDKKKQRELKIEISRLEAELEAKHDAEIQAARQVEQCSTELEAVSIQGNSMEDAEAVGSTKRSKAAKRREKKEREEREREERIKQGELESLSGARHQEQLQIAKLLSDRKLRLYNIPSDGNCLYKAVAHQLSLRNGQPELSVQQLRTQTAAELRKRRDEYLPYITTPDGDMVDEEGYEQYCDKLEHTSEWGGQIEIRAMAHIFGHPIQVLQAGLSDVLIESGNQMPLLTVVHDCCRYHRKLYELGEHYNSVLPTGDEES